MSSKKQITFHENIIKTDYTSTELRLLKDGSLSLYVHDFSADCYIEIANIKGYYYDNDINDRFYEVDGKYIYSGVYSEELFYPDDKLVKKTIEYELITIMRWIISDIEDHIESMKSYKETIEELISENEKMKGE